jgi:feruloyl esterase
LADFKFDRASFGETTRLHSLYDATDPDLSAFSSAGGKLILWHGMADPHISPLNTIAYYTAMQQLLGKPAVERFARLYLFPGGYHCGGGGGPFNVDLLSPIMAWVENGLAPGALIASHVPGNGVPSGPPPSAAGTRPPMEQPSDMRTLPSAIAKPDRTRPVFPYPLTAKYTGTGSIDDAKTFLPGSAEPVPASALNWMGLSFYSARFQQWCTASGSNMTCAPKQ